MLDLEDVSFIGSGLNRPECVLAHASGRLFVSDWTDGGGVAVVEADGRSHKILARDRTAPLRPNGIALLPGGSFLIAHLGPSDGGIWRLDPDGRTAPVLIELGDMALPPTNFVYRDDLDRLWITVSTRQHPRDRGYRSDVADGFVVLADGQEPRIVADGLGYTNECCVDPKAGRLYINETFARRLTAFDIAPDGTLTNRPRVAEFGPGTFPDGLALDDKGGLWITSIVSNRLLRVSAAGDTSLELEDGDEEHLAWVEEAFQAGTLGRPHLDQVKSRQLCNISCLAFGGDDLRTAYLGCLLGDSVARLRLPVAGHPPPHWRYDLGPLGD